MTKTPPLLQLKDIEYSIGTTTLFRGVNLSIDRSARICLVGRNGSGKSTLMKMIASQLEPDEGEVFIQPGVRVSYMVQDPIFPKSTTALAYVENQEHATKHRAESLLDALGIAYDKDLENLSGGEARRVSLAHALVSEPDVVLLDEPTNHLDVATIEWLEKYLKTFPGAILMISHDRTFLKNTTSVTFWLDQGIIRRLNQGYGQFQDWADKIMEEETKAQIKLDKVIEAETEWSYAGISARRKRNQGRLARLQDLRQKRAQQIRSIKMKRLEAETADPSSKSIIEAIDISKSYDGKELIKNFSTLVNRGDRIGIIGPNGSGKTTLLKILIGLLKPDSGKIKIAKNLMPVYLDQARTKLDPDKSLIETLCPKGGDFVTVMGKHKHVIAYLKEFLFHPDQVRGPVRVLSGGEKNRLLLAMSLTQESNMMILDEPTNDLDMDTLDRLQDMLAAYDGTLIIVSHDRAFLDNVVTSTIVLEGDGTAIEYAGGYEDYLAQKRGGKPKREEITSAKNTKKTLEREKSKPKKLSFNDQYALKTIPSELEKIESELKVLESQLNDPSIYEKGHEVAHEIAQKISDLRNKKEELEAKWLALEMLREEIEGS